MNEWVDELAERLTGLTWIVAGSSILSLILDTPFKDVDLFSPCLDAIAERLSIPLTDPKVTRAGNLELIQMSGEYPGAVLGSFDLNVCACGYGPEGLVLSEACIEGLTQGQLELIADPWHNPRRTAHRAAKYIERLGWQVGPKLTLFMKEYLATYPTAPIQDHVFQEGYAPYKKIGIEEARKLPRPTIGISHPLELTERS